MAEPRGHFREWTMEELVFLLEESNFRVLKKGYMDIVGTAGLVRDRFALRMLYLPYRILTAIKPTMRSQIAIVAKKS